MITCHFKSDFDSFYVFMGLVLRVGYGFLLNPTLNRSPEPRLQKVLSCGHPCHTWDLRPCVKWLSTATSAGLDLKWLASQGLGLHVNRPLQTLRPRPIMSWNLLGHSLMLDITVPKGAPYLNIFRFCEKIYKFGISLNAHHQHHKWVHTSTPKENCPQMLSHKIWCHEHILLYDFYYPEIIVDTINISRSRLHRIDQRINKHNVDKYCNIYIYALKMNFAQQNVIQA